MRVPDLESIIDEAELASNNHLSKNYQVDVKEWQQWAAAQMEKEEQIRKNMYKNLPKIDGKEPAMPWSGYNPLGKLTYKITSSDNAWINPPPPELKAPKIKTRK